MVLLKNVGNLEVYVMNYLQQNLKKLLNDHKMTQKTLAEKAGISLDTVKKIFRTNIEYTPNAITLDSIAGVFGIKADMLLVPQLEQLKQDIKDIEASNIDIKKYDEMKQFRIAMVEGGFDDIVALIDYLQFMGYYFVFVDEYPEGRPDEDAIMKAKNDLIKMQKKYHKQLAEYKCKLDECDDPDERMEYQIEIMGLEDCIKNLDANVKKGRNVYKPTFAELIAQRRIDVNKIVRFFNSLAEMTKSEREDRLKKSDIVVFLTDNPFALENQELTSDSEGDFKKLSIYEFYKKCESINRFIRQQF